MRVSKKVIVAGHEISIVYKKRPLVNGQEVWGYYDDDKSVICLAQGMDKTRKLEILLHEIIHSISDIHLLSLSEKAVKILGIEILAAVKNNNLNLLGRKNAKQ